MNIDEVDAFIEGLQDQEQYEAMLKDLEKNGIYDAMIENWQQEDAVIKLKTKDNEVYNFYAENPYLQEQNPLEKALQLLEQDYRWAILAFEAHLQKNANDSKSWKMLGRLLQDSDQDDQAVSALLNAYKYDPNDLGTLSSLGVSCTNTLDEVRAMNYLKQWLMKNSYYEVKIYDQIVPDNTTNADYKPNDLQQMNAEMIDVYQQAMQQNPNDIELISGLAVLFFIKRSFQDAVVLFKKALLIEPNNYQIWNKLGATLAHLGRVDQAMFCYHRALDLKPNYVRAWVNLAISYSSKNECTEAARLYLNALTLSPQAKHIWGYLQTTLIQSERHDLIQKVFQQDPSLFVNEFPAQNLELLAQPGYKQIYISLCHS